MFSAGLSIDLKILHIDRESNKCTKDRSNGITDLTIVLSNSCHLKERILHVNCVLICIGQKKIRTFDHGRNICRFQYDRRFSLCDSSRNIFPIFQVLVLGIAKRSYYYFYGINMPTETTQDLAVQHSPHQF